MKMTIDKKICIIITSVIYFKKNKLSYSESRSVFTPEKRLEQTKKTILSIREKLPQAKIYLGEQGLKDVSSEIKDLVDYYEYIGDFFFIRKATDGPFKGLGEALGLIYTYKKLYKNYDYYFKLSGRYALNENFNLNKFISEKPFSAKIYNKKSISTRLYFFRKEYLYQWLLKHIMCIPFLLFNRSIERLLYIFIKTKNINSIDILGVKGSIGPDGKLIEE